MGGTEAMHSFLRSRDAKKHPGGRSRAKIVCGTATRCDISAEIFLDSLSNYERPKKHGRIAARRMKDERFYSRNLCFVVFPSGDGFRRRKDFRKLTRKDELVKTRFALMPPNRREKFNSAAQSCA